jgi:BT1 family
MRPSAKYVLHIVSHPRLLLMMISTDLTSQIHLPHCTCLSCLDVILRTYNVARRSRRDLMPAVVLTAACCPKGMEATVYALLAGFQNYGSNVSRSLGVGVINVLGIKTTAPCNFINLPMAIVLCHIVMPLLTLPLIFILIPDALMTEKLLLDEQDTVDSEGDRGKNEDGDKEFNEDDDRTGFDGGEGDTRRPLVPTAPIDMELDSMYSESDVGQSSVTSSFPTDAPSSIASAEQGTFRLGSMDSSNGDVVSPPL